jgi:phosphatidylglycerol:prolipoprotein diacylglycerol transferase
MSPLIPYFDAGYVRVTSSISLDVQGLCNTVGFSVAAVLALRKAKREGLDEKIIVRALPLLLTGMIVGGHLVDVLAYRQRDATHDPSIWLRVWDGQSSVGAFLGCLLVWFLYTRRCEVVQAQKHHQRFQSWRYADALAYGGTLGWVFVRLGCFAVHDHPGVETRFWLAVYGICPDGSQDRACHDLGLDEALLSVTLFIFLLKLMQRPRFPGFYCGILALLYGVGRFSLDTLRHPLVDARYGGLTLAQYACLILVCSSACIFLSGWRQRVA